MKIAARATQAYLTRPDAQHRAILLYGPDSGLVRERSKILISAFLGDGYDPFALADKSGAQLLEDPALLADELSTIHFMAPRRVILVCDASDKLARLFEDSAAYFNSGTLLVACADELSARSSLRGWFEKEACTAAIACYHDDVRDIQDIIRKTLETAGVQVDRSVQDYLAAQLGNDRLVTHQELGKLITYAGDSRKISLEDAQNLVGYNREANFDDLVNALADRNLQQLDRTLMLLLREGTQPVAYIRALLRYFNRLYYIKAKMAEGMSAEAVIQSLRPQVFFKQVPIMTRHAQHWSLASLARALRMLVNAEHACKSSDIPAVPASSRFLLQVTQLR